MDRFARLPCPKERITHRILLGLSQVSKSGLGSIGPLTMIDPMTGMASRPCGGGREHTYSEKVDHQVLDEQNRTKGDKKAKRD